MSRAYEMVSRLETADDLEARHRREVLAWLASTDDVYRRVKPAVPPQHLVSYVVPVDPADGSILLVDHINAGLWLPPGGHVEPGEDPADAARREATEELGLTAEGLVVTEQPLFLTVTGTVGIDSGHTDVSLWFLLDLGQGQPLTPDPGEFTAVRWWSPADLAAADRSRFDPHFFRFLTKLNNRPRKR